MFELWGIVGLFWFVWFIVGWCSWEYLGIILFRVCWWLFSLGIDFCYGWYGYVLVVWCVWLMGLLVWFGWLFGYWVWCLCLVCLCWWKILCVVVLVLVCYLVWFLMRVGLLVLGFIGCSCLMVIVMFFLGCCWVL